MILQPMTEPAMAASSLRPGPVGRIRAYLWLGSQARLLNFLGAPVLWSALPADERFSGRTAALLAVGMLACLGGLGAGSALDQLTGYRDGSDAANYGTGRPERPLRGKPLLTGLITVEQAKRYAVGCAVVSVVTFVAMWGSVGWRPWWLPLAAASIIFVCINYSWGAQFSYHGGLEVSILFGFGALVPLGESVILGGPSARCLYEGAMVGIWQFNASLHSNANDAAGDRSAGRQTWAVSVERQRYLNLLGAVSVVPLAVAAVAAAAGALPWWSLALVSVPSAMALAAWRLGSSTGDHIVARNLVFKAHWVGAGCLVLTNLVMGR